MNKLLLLERKFNWESFPKHYPYKMRVDYYKSSKNSDNDIATEYVAKIELHRISYEVDECDSCVFTDRYTFVFSIESRVSLDIENYEEVAYNELITLFNKIKFNYES